MPFCPPSGTIVKSEVGNFDCRGGAWLHNFSSDGPTVAHMLHHCRSFAHLRSRTTASFWSSTAEKDVHTAVISRTDAFCLCEQGTRWCARCCGATACFMSATTFGIDPRVEHRCAAANAGLFSGTWV